MASTFTTTPFFASMVSPNGHKSDKKLMRKLSSSSFGRRHNMFPRPRRSSSAIVCAAKELHFNKDETTIRKLQVEDSELADVAAVGNNEVGNMIAEAMSKVGRKGVVTLEEGKNAENNLYVVEGMQFDCGYRCLKD